MEEQNKTPRVKHCPPVIAIGSEPSINTKLALQEAMVAWQSQHGIAPVKAKKKTALREPTKKVYDTLVRYTFIGESNHRRPDSLGSKFVDWLMENPGACEADIKASGHDIKHLKWDLKYNRSMIKVDEPQR